MSEGDLWVDRPTVEGGRWILVVVAAFALFMGGAGAVGPSGLDVLFSVLFFLGSIGMGAFIIWSWAYVRYELTDTMLECRAGPSRTSLKLSDLTRVEVLRGHRSRLRLMTTTQMLNRWNCPLLLVDRSGRHLLIGPTDPEAMRAEILRRRDALRGDTP